MIKEFLVERERRIEVCNKCPLFVKEHNICAKCGCNAILKASVPGFRCPVRKW
jgi:hypothetical protein